MDPRYTNEKITQLWSNDNKLNLWQRTELAMMEARVKLGRMAATVFEVIKVILLSNQINLAWWKNRDKEIGHDLQAFVDERCQHLTNEEAPEFHKEMTSYDTEEPAFCEMLLQSLATCGELMPALFAALEELAIKFRYTPMLAVTHGQPAELQSFGKRVLTWDANIKDAWEIVKLLLPFIQRSKMSGMVGNYGGVDPELERVALEIMGLRPYYGATQIMPRGPLAMMSRALCQLVQEIDKIALDIRLGARGGTGKAIYQEPFGRMQKGSSRNPAKKNCIKTEQLRGMARMAMGYDDMIQANIETWDERAIEQSCVERVAWPDLFHVVCHSIKTITAVLEGLAVYPDNMMREIVESRGCYAAGQVKEFVREQLAQLGFTVEEAYRLVQLASFNVFGPNDEDIVLRTHPPLSLTNADKALEYYMDQRPPKPVSILTILEDGLLEPTEELDISEEDVVRFNGGLQTIFQYPTARAEFEKLFRPTYLLRNEGVLFQEIIGE